MLILLMATTRMASAQADATLAAAKQLRGLIDELADTGSVNEGQLGLAWQALHKAEYGLPPQIKASAVGPGPPKGYIACGVLLGNASVSARMRAVQRTHQETQAAIQCYENALGSQPASPKPVVDCPAVDFGAFETLPLSAYLARLDPERAPPPVILVGGLDALSPVLDYDIRRELETFLHVPKGPVGSLIRYIVKDNTRGLDIPNPFSTFLDVSKQHAFLCHAPEALSKLLEAWAGETRHVEQLRARIRRSGKVSPDLQDEFNTAVKAQRILTDSIIYLRKAYVDNFNSLGPMEKAGYRTPQEMNFPSWAWSNTY